MGCVSSKPGRPYPPSPEYRYNHHLHGHPHHHRHNASSRSVTSVGDNSRNGGGYGHMEKKKEDHEKENDDRRTKNNSGILNYSNSSNKGGGNNEKKIGFSIKFGRQKEAEHVAAGWPAWLTSVAPGAVEGWLPLRSDTFERLEKIGQGTYSSVYRARDVETGKMVALKKVRFDNYHPESVRFMAREISILRKLHHPNIMTLEGIVTSRLSCNIYLVFEYMEHDLAGLLSCPDIKFSESQIKCYMKQLLRGVEHCHSRGIMHRDIKTSNILVNNEGVLKIADFGLANVVSVKYAQPLTSRVVTLWYRPPELLLGSTSYDSTVDLWSVGCVFAELFTGRAILKGRNEVEQLHKIFKLCGSPPDEYWNRSKLPLGNMFKPQQPYGSTLHERYKDLPKTAVNVIETFLSIEPSERGSALNALGSEYFNTKPFPCKKSSMPKYPPNKEIDAKFRDDARRKQASGMSQVSGASSNIRRVHKEPISFSKLPTEEVSANVQVSRRNIGSGVRKGRASKFRSSMKKPLDTLSEASEMTVESHNDSIVSVPVKVSLSNSLAFAKLHDPSSSRLRSKAISKSHQLDMVGSDWQTNDGSWNSSNIYQSQKHPKGYVGQETRARSGPLLIPKPDSNQDTESQQVDRRSRPQVTVTATPRRFSDIGVIPFRGFLALKARDNVSSQKHEMDQEKTNKRWILKDFESQESEMERLMNALEKYQLNFKDF